MRNFSNTQEEWKYYMCNRCHTTVIKQTCCGCTGCNFWNTLFNNGFQYICRDACGNIRVNGGNTCSCGCGNTTTTNATTNGCGCCYYNGNTQTNGTGCGCYHNYNTQQTTNGNYATGFGCCRRGWNVTDDVATTTDGETYYARQYGCGQTRGNTCGCGY
ncbi:MAG: hypothetical protein IKA88_01790 [Clostridia bacterium]|nr:hypothetical protein [Clostridia bacterium]